MDRKKMLTHMASIVLVYLVAVIMAGIFITFLVQGEWLRAAGILWIELCLFYLGKQLRKHII